MVKIPTLSVIIGVYNKAEYLGTALDSVLSQSFRPQEIIIIDDCSTDGSYEILREYADNHKLLKLVRQESNKGAERTYNEGVALTSGDYVYMMGADDVIFPDFFEKSLTLLELHPKAALCTSDPGQFFEKNGLLLENRLQWSPEPRYFEPEEFAEILKGWYLAAHPTIVKRSILIDSGIHNPLLRWHSDWFFWLVIAFRYGICYVPEPLAAIRVRQESFSSGRKDWKQQREVLVNLLKMLRSPEYKDVLPCFIRSSALSHFGAEIVRATMSAPDLWDEKTLMLIQNPLWEWNRSLSQFKTERMKEFEKNYTEETLKGSLQIALSALKHRRFEEVNKIFEGLMNRFSHNPLYHSTLADVMLSTGDFNSAINHAAEAVKLLPEDPALYNLLGMCYYHAGRRGDAEGAFSEALDHNPDDLNAQMNLAQLARLQGDFSASTRHLKNAMKAHPENLGLLYAAGRNERESGEEEAAKTYFRKALAIAPERDDIKSALASF